MKKIKRATFSIALILGVLLLSLVYYGSVWIGRDDASLSKAPAQGASSISELTDASHEQNAIDSESGRDGGLKWLSDSDVKNIDFTKIMTQVQPSDQTHKVKNIHNRDEAYAYITDSLSLVPTIRCAYEDRRFFYFSGGTTTKLIYDFSYGVAVEKSSGVIYSWVHISVR